MNNNNNLEFSLKSLCKNRLKGMLIQLRQDNPSAKSFIMVVDKRTLKIISCYMKMSELLEQGINAIENLHLIRKPFQLDAIYFITPSQESIQLLIKDYNQDQAQYKNAHIFFNNKLYQMAMIQNEPNLIKRISTCKVTNLDFICPTNRTFNLDIPQGLDVYKGRQTTFYEIADKLCTVLISFEKFYTFEFLTRQDQQGICSKLSKMIQLRLGEILDTLKKSSSSSYDYQERNCGKIRLIIVDRTIDVLSPMLHDFYYQSMFYDLLDIQGDIYTYNQDKKAIISDNDEIFRKYKYKHVAEVLDGVSGDFYQFAKTNMAAKAVKEQNMDSKQMIEIVRSMPEYQESVNKYTMHMEIAEKSLDIFRIKDLPEIGELEQTLATGFDKKGNSVSGEKLIQRIIQSFNNPNLQEFDKLRLVLAAIIQIDVVEKDRMKLTQNLNPTHLNAIHNLKYFGISASKASGKSHKRVTQQAKKYAKSKMANEALELCRNTPFIEQVLEEMAGKDYSFMEGFEKSVINEENIAQNKGKSLRQKGRIAQLLQTDNDCSFNEKDKTIIFCVGGIGYNEIRSLMNNQKINSQNNIVIVGSTELLKPNEYVQELIKFDQL